MEVHRTIFFDGRGKRNRRSHFNLCNVSNIGACIEPVPLGNYNWQEDMMNKVDRISFDFDFRQPFWMDEGIIVGGGFCFVEQTLNYN